MPLCLKFNDTQFTKNDLRKILLQEKRKVRPIKIILIVIWVILLVLSLSLLSILASLLAGYPQVQSISSLTWAGYIIEKNSNSRFEVTAVNASWIVPNVNVTEGGGYSSAWIGIGGQLDKTLIQVGTEQDVTSGQGSYYAWYELLPSFAVRLTDLIVAPGNTMIASINLINSDSNLWNIKMSDVTTGQAFNSNVVYNSARSSGEWIVERPTVINQTGSLADFGTIMFTGCHVNVNYAAGPITQFSFSKIQMANNLNSELASTSDPTDDGTAFTVSYIAGM